MKKLHQLVCVALLLPILGTAQGIRKNYTEMTQAEQDAYVTALNGLYNDDPSLDIVKSFSQEDSPGYYWNYYGDVFQAPCNTREYLPFHRMMLWEMENAIQRKNPRLTIPYWDWTVNSSPDDYLFNGFLSPYKLPDWDIMRNTGAFGGPPSVDEMNSIKSSTGFCDDNNISASFNDAIEYPMTNEITDFIGPTGDDPRDPIFFLSHAMTDKVWQQWETTNHKTFTDITLLDRYDGYTPSVYVNPLPATDPHDIFDSRALGIFYSDNGVATMDSYDVKNTYQNPENFSYSGKIIANNFTIGPGKNAVFTSATGVEIGQGFVVNNGTLEIDVGGSYYDNFPLAKKGLHKPIPGQKNLGENAKITIVRSLAGFVAHMELQSAADVHGFVSGIDGKIISRLQGGQMESGSHDLDLNLAQNQGGLYYVYFRIGDQTYKRLLPRF